MPRTTKLTWQPGSGTRSGRWRKKYRGKVYYFDGGRGKSDRSAYDLALKQWELAKLAADAEAPRKHQREYETEINTWEQVLSWSNRHGDVSMAQTAFEKRQKLQVALEAPILAPVTEGDRFANLFQSTFTEIQDDLIAEAIADLATGTVKSLPWRPMSPETRDWIAREFDGSETRIQREIWNDRLETQQRRVAVRHDTIEEYVGEFLNFKKAQVAQQELSLGRVYAIQLHLTHFQDWAGKDTSVSELNGSALRDYHSALLALIATSKPKGSRRSRKKSSWTSTTARHYLVTVKSFVRWLWEIEAISTLPRALGHSSSTLKIASETPAPVTFEDEEITLLLEAATGRTKLYILLMLNCGMTQKDVADLRKTEVDLHLGRIIRKRSKTDHFESVPIVSYLLWPETIRLLGEFIDSSAGHLALLNSNGSPLWSEHVEAEGKYRKTDNIKNAFDRLRKELGIGKSLKCLKKTSSSKLRDNERFNGIEDLFLGHAPQKMSDKHYTTSPQKLLDAGVSWLAEQYGLQARL